MGPVGFRGHRNTGLSGYCVIRYSTCWYSMGTGRTWHMELPGRNQACCKRS